MRINEPLDRSLLENVAVPVESMSAVSLSEVPLPQGLPNQATRDETRPAARRASCPRSRAAAIRTPGALPPWQKFTLPSGVPVGMGVTFAVSVTVWPAFAGFGETVSAVVVIDRRC